MTDPKNNDPKNQEETLEQPTAAAEESAGAELSDEELDGAAGGQVNPTEQGQRTKGSNGKLVNHTTIFGESQIDP